MERALTLERISDCGPSSALSYPAQTILRVKLHNQKEIMIPYVDQFVKNVDLANSKIFVELIEGFL